MNKPQTILLILLLTCLMFPCCSQGDFPETADLAIINAKIITLSQGQPYAEALALSGDRILAVGSNDEIERFITGDTEVLAL